MLHVVTHRNLHRGPYSRSRLFDAVRNGNLKDVKFFINIGMDLDSRNEYGFGLLTTALSINDDFKRNRMFKYLIDSGADTRLKDVTHERNTLIWSCIMCRRDEMSFLIKNFCDDIDLNEKDKDGKTLLHHAVLSGNVDLVRRVLRGISRYSLSVDPLDSVGLSPYLYAKRMGFEHIASVLLQEGRASPGLADSIQHKNAFEWSEIGNMERQKMERERRIFGRNRCKLHGCAFRNLHRHEGVANITNPHKLKKMEKSPPSLTQSLPEIKVQHFDGESNGNQEHPDSKMNGSVVGLISVSTGPRQCMSNELSPLKSVFSLLSLTEKGQLVDKYYRSQDTISRHEEAPHQPGNNQAMASVPSLSLENIMQAASDQQSNSFRESSRHIPMISLSADVIPSAANAVGARKVSSLAILMGERRKRKPPQKQRLRRNRKSCKV